MPLYVSRLMRMYVLCFLFLYRLRHIRKYHKFRDLNRACYHWDPLSSRTTSMIVWLKLKNPPMENHPLLAVTVSSTLIRLPPTRRRRKGSLMLGISKHHPPNKRRIKRAKTSERGNMILYLERANRVYLCMIVSTL